ncbi:MAG TPA: 16S rRNA (adenine(1518)-N(6)/adenine(1519)-N(6))-dimethyltransferase RsmA [Burkholderiaceae bacterium]|nr:16S rRNA (adenine(1518)-N(6)/adenine(1519)-N(6))-dimethyltransferase RsmA [Burkholderiaceae bacterium]
MSDGRRAALSSSRAHPGGGRTAAGGEPVLAAGPHQARKRFGQNFLHDAGVIARIVDAIDPRLGEAIVEIGPGQGALTGALIDRANHIRAIEIDRDLAARLHVRFSAAQLTLIEADALKVDWDAIASTPLRIVGNLPYNISTPLLFALVPIAGRVIDQHFMLQKEVVDRIVAAPGSKTYGRLSVMLQFRYRLTKLFDVASGAFKPAPKVTSSVVRMQPRATGELFDVDMEVFACVVAAAFGQRRKTLRNALSTLLNTDQIVASGVDPQARAETLRVQSFVELARQATAKTL